MSLRIILPRFFNIIFFPTHSGLIVDSGAARGLIDARLVVVGDCRLSVDFIL